MTASRFPPRVQSLADHGLLFTFGDAIRWPLTQRIAHLRDLIAELDWEDVADLVPAYTTLTLIGAMTWQRQHEVACHVLDAWPGTVVDGETITPEREIVIPVVYGGTHGPDLDEIACHTGLSGDEVVRRHAGAMYTVGALGFAPGFAYLIGLPEELATPRRAVPRTRVPHGSVAIGGSQTGVYALPTPGGWSVLGRTAMTMFDPTSAEPSRLMPGDRVRFQPVTQAIFTHTQTQTQTVLTSSLSGRDAIEVRQPGLQTTVQDGGRQGYGRFGVAPNGAADRVAWSAGNAALGNPTGAAALEVTGQGLELRFLRTTRFVVTGAELGPQWNGLRLVSGAVRIALPGDELRFTAPVRRIRRSGVRAYLGVGGGIDVEPVLESRSTDLSAQFGGVQGRPLRSGDRLRAGRTTGSNATDAVARVAATGPLQVMRGPQADWFDDATFARLVTQKFTVSPSSSRVGLRLEGVRLAPTTNAELISEGMVTGAIQVTGEGQPIVMLPGRATVGGYPKIAIVVEADLDRLGQLGPGDAMRFVEVKGRDYRAES